MSTPSPPIGWGSTYCFTAVSVGVRVGAGVLVSVTPITKAPPAQNFLGGMFLFPISLSFDFCHDLDFGGQGQAVRAFFVVMRFSLFYQILSDFDQTWQEASKTFGT